MPRQATVGFPSISLDAIRQGFRAVGVEIGSHARGGGDVAPSERWAEMWRLGRLAAGDDATLATRVGRAIPFGAFGLLDHLAASAPSLDGILRALTDHMGMVAARVSFHYAPPELEIIARSAASFEAEEMTIACLLRTVHGLVGGDVLAEIHLSRPEAPAIAELYDVPVHFASQRARLVFRSDRLDAVSRNADVNLHQSLTDAARRLGFKSGISPLRRQVRALLPGLLAEGQATGERVAACLGMSRRTLFRRLRSDGATFQGVLDDHLRAESARRLLAGERVIEVAQALGYADQASFTRAFQRWHALPPGRWLTEAKSR